MNQIVRAAAQARYGPAPGEDPGRWWWLPGRVALRARGVTSLTGWTRAEADATIRALLQRFPEPLPILREYYSAGYEAGTRDATSHGR